MTYPAREDGNIRLASNEQLPVHFIKRLAVENIDEESQRIWNDLGPWWDANVEDGDAFHRAFVFPAIQKLLDLKGGEKILDAGCGNGSLARLMAKEKTEVLGIDFSSTLIRQALERSRHIPSISYEEGSLTDRKRLKEVAKHGPFDRLVCSMVLHNLSSLHPLFESIRLLLKPSGSFIFCIPHPCFNSPSVSFDPPAGVTIKSYAEQTICKLRSKPGQPIEQLVFHRPMRDYFNLLIDQGLTMNGFEEPTADLKALPKENLWAQRPSLTPALISRWIFATGLP